MATARNPYHNRVTEIWCDAAGGSVGSGYVIGNAGLVLTARHVLDPAASGKAPATIQARPLACRESAWLDATLVWPAQPAQLADQALDAALIRIEPWAHAGLFGAQTSVGLPDDDGDDGVAVTAIGFPRLAGDDRNRDTEQIAGRVRTGNRMKSGKYQIEDLSFSDGTKNAGLDWHGISGAALLVRGKVVGVVITRKQSDRFDFGAVRMEELLRDAAFREALGASADLGAGEADPPPQPDFVKLTCLLGRDPQEEGFEDLYDQCVLLADGRAHPRAMLCLVPGAASGEHGPEDLADRFALRSLPRRQWPRVEFVWLTWPRTTVLERGLDKLRGELWLKLCSDPTLRAPAEPSAYRDLLERGRPRLFQSDLTQHAATPGLAGLIAAWSQFWGELSRLSDGRPPIHLLLVGHPDQATTTDWLEQVPGFDGTVIAPLPDLGDCGRLDLRQWLDDRLVAFAEPHWRKRLDLKLSPTYDRSTRFNVMDFKNDLRRIAPDA